VCIAASSFESRIILELPRRTGVFTGNPSGSLYQGVAESLEFFWSRLEPHWNTGPEEFDSRVAGGPSLLGKELVRFATY
jgi:hypothetical protein